MAFRPPSATQTLTASGSVTAWGPIVLVNSAVAVTVTLPRGLASDTQKPTEIKNIGLGAVTVAAFAGDVLTGQSVLTQNTAVTYEVSSAGVIQSVADIGAAATSTPLANGSAFVAATTAIAPVTSATSVVAVSVTLPNIGTYEIHTRIRGGGAAATSKALESALFLNPASTTFNTAGGGTMVANSEVLALFSTAVNPGVVQATGSGVAIVTTTVANTVINMQVWASSTGADMLSDNNGRSGLVYIQLPSATTVPAGSVTVTALNKFVARKDNATSQNIPSGVNTDVIFGVLSASVGSGYNSATGVFTSPSAGWYSFDAAVRMEYNTASAPQEMFILIVVNGVEKGRGAFAFTGTNANGTSFHYAQASVAVPLAIGDLVKVQCRQDTGFARVLNTADALNYFCGVEAATATVVDPGLVTPTALTQIEVTQTADQTTGLTVGSPVLFSSPATVGALPFAAGVFTLGANKTYSLLGGVTLIVGTEMVFQWRDIGSGLLIGNSGNVLTNAAGRGVTASATVVTTAATTVRLEITSVNALTSINSGLGRGAWAKILELPVSTVVNPGTVPVTTLAYGRMYQTSGVVAATPSAGSPYVTSGLAFVGGLLGSTTGTAATASFVVGTAGYYRARAFGNTRSTTGSSGMAWGIYVNGALALQGGGPVADAVSDDISITVEGRLPNQLSIGDIVSLRPTFGADAHAIQEFELEQVSTSSIFQITPGALSAVTLGYASASSPSYVPTAVGDVPFTVVDASGLANTGTTFTLLAGKRYYMDARLGFNSNTGTASQIGYQIVRADNSVITGVSAGIWMNQVAQATGGGESPGSTGFLTPTADTQVKVRVTSTSGPIAGASTFGVFLIQEQAVTNLVNPATVPVNTLMPAATVFDGAYVSATVGNIGHTNGAPFTPTVTGTYAVTVGGSAYSPAVGFSITNISLRQGVTTLQGKSASIYMTAAGPHHQLTSKTFYQALTAGTTYNIYAVSGSNATIDAGDFWTVELEQLTTATVIVAGSVAAMTGATAGAAGTSGWIGTAPAAGQQDAYLTGDATWDVTDRLVALPFTAATSGVVSTAALSVDVAGQLNVTASAASLALTLPSPTATTKNRRVIVTNTGVANAFTINATLVPLGGAATLVWNASLASPAWELLGATATPSVQRFTGTGAYTPTPGMKYCIVEAVGGGGAGFGAPANPGATSANYGAPGQGGGYVKVLLTAAQIGVGQAVTIGAGGIGGITGSGLGGSATTLGSLFSAPGGLGGPSSVGYNTNFVGGLLSIARSSTVATPTITTGTNLALVTSYPGLPSLVGGNANFFGYSMGDGGDTPLGNGAKAPSASNTGSTSSAVVAGVSANANTGGGGTSGMTYGAAAAAQSGGNGGSGLMVITEFFV